MLGAEDLEVENLDRNEKLLIKKHGKLSRGLENNIDKIRQMLLVYEIDDVLLSRVSDVMYEATKMEDLKSVEASVKHLADTFWE